MSCADEDAVVKELIKYSFCRDTLFRLGREFKAEHEHPGRREREHEGWGDESIKPDLSKSIETDAIESIEADECNIMKSDYFCGPLETKYINLKFESGKKSAELDLFYANSAEKTERNWKIPQIFLLLVFAF